MIRFKGGQGGRRIGQEQYDAMRADLTGQLGMSPIVRHTGSKNKPHYRMLQRNALARAGATGIQTPFGGPANDILNVLPQGASDYNELDFGTAALVDAVKNQGNEGMTVDWSMLQGLSDQELKDYFNRYIRGPNMTERRAGASIPDDTLTHFTALLRDRPYLTDEQRQRYALALYRNKRAGWRGQVRYAKTPFEGMQFPSNPPDVPTMRNLPTSESLLNYRDPLQNVNVRQGDGAEALAEWDIDNNKLLINDPPYSGEPGSYGVGFDPRPTLRQLEERIQEGQPVIAFDSIAPIEQYKDIGLDTTIINRPDNSGANPSLRGDKLEMVGVANIPDMDGHSINELLQNHGYGRFLPKENKQTDLMDFMMSEPQNAFEGGWAVLKQGAFF